MLPGVTSSHKTEIQLDIYPSLSRQADDMRLCCEPVSTTAFSSFPAHCKSKQRWEVMHGMRDECRMSGVSALHTPVTAEMPTSPHASPSLLHCTLSARRVSPRPPQAPKSWLLSCFLNKVVLLNNMLLGPEPFLEAFAPAESRRGSPRQKGISWRVGNTKECGGKEEKCEITLGERKEGWHLRKTTRL